MKQAEILDACTAAGYAPAVPSMREKAGRYYLIAEKNQHKVLLVVGAPDERLKGQREELAGFSASICPLSAENADAIRSLFPYTAPQSPQGHAVTLGLGDRLGIVTGAHIRAVQGTKVFPVLAQQSKRELMLTGRSNRSMLDDVAWQVFEAGYEGGYAADGDHLKTLEEVQAAIADGDTMITLDCSDYIDNCAAHLSPQEAEQACREKLDAAQVETWMQEYEGKTVALGDHAEIIFERDALPAILLTYAPALPFIETVYREAICRSPHPVALEISIDETEVETTPAAHYFVAAELHKRKVSFCSMAPRFCGEFQKGIDYIGDVSRFQVEFDIHARIARQLGYRISVHSGSDKFRVFPHIGRLSEQVFHLKTSGTSWVEAVRVIAQHAPDLFRRMAAFSCSKFPEAKTFYHVSAQLANVPVWDTVADEDLPGLLDQDDVRQVMHITYGYLLQEKDAEGSYVFRDAIYQTLYTYRAELEDTICRHIRRHLTSLGVV